MPTEDKYKKINDYIKEREDWLDSFAKTGLELRVERQAAQAVLKELEISWNDEKSKIEKNQVAMNKLSLAKRQKDNELQQAREELENRIHQDKLDSLILEQPPFENALRGQIETFATTRFEGLSFETESPDLEEVMEKILQPMNNSRNYSPSTIDWRAAKYQYNESIRQICETRIKGKTLTSQDTQSRFTGIINCLRAYEAQLFG
jgi:hypothetical protein